MIVNGGTCDVYDKKGCTAISGEMAEIDGSRFIQMLFDFRLQYINFNPFCLCQQSVVFRFLEHTSLIVVVVPLFFRYDAFICNGDVRLCERFNLGMSERVKKLEKDPQFGGSMRIIDLSECFFSAGYYYCTR